MAERRRPVQREKAEQASIVKLAETLGGKVYVLGTRRSRGRACPQCGAFVPGDMGTRQTPGIADLEIWFPARPSVDAGVLLSPRLLKWETKAPSGRRSLDQDVYADLVMAAGVTYGVGGYDDFVSWTIAQGYCREIQFPHYRCHSPEAIA